MKLRNDLLGRMSRDQVHEAQELSLEFDDRMRQF